MLNGLNSCRPNPIGMNDYIPLSSLNDFIFCPYSIYLHNVYMEADEDMYKAMPQTKGTIAHKGVDERNGSTRKDDIMSMAVYSDELGISGKIDVYKQDRRILIERKNNLKHIFRGQIYQLWGQYFCLKEMGYEVEKLAFYEITTNKMTYLEVPGQAEKQELMEFINKFKSYNPASDMILVNANKCKHCIYCNLCDQTTSDNVYT